MPTTTQKKRSGTSRRKVQTAAAAPCPNGPLSPYAGQLPNWDLTPPDGFIKRVKRNP